MSPDEYPAYAEFTIMMNVESDAEVDVLLDRLRRGSCSISPARLEMEHAKVTITHRIRPGARIVGGEDPPPFSFERE